MERIPGSVKHMPEDMVPVGCADCEGCSECCRSTADTIILDPQDMYLLSKGTGKVFTDMIEREIEIRLVDGLILPNLMDRGSAVCIPWGDITRRAVSAISCRRMSAQAGSRRMSG